MIVVDTNVVAYFLIPGGNTRDAEALRSKDSQWLAPALFRHEWLSVVINCVRHGMFDRDDAARLYRRGLAVVAIDDGPPDPISIINLHQASGCTSYDCEFVALATRRNLKLVTVDAEVLNAFKGTALALSGFEAGLED